MEKLIFKTAAETLNNSKFQMYALGNWDLTVEEVANVLYFLFEKPEQLEVYYQKLLKELDD